MKNIRQKPLVSPRHVSTSVRVAMIVACISLASAVANAMTPAVEKQISQIMAMKSTFTPTEKKMSSDLVFRSRGSAGQGLGPMAGVIKSDKTQPTMMVNVNIGGKPSPELRALIEANGGKVTGSSDQYARLSATIPLKGISTVAAHPDVKWIREAMRPAHNVGALTSQGYISQQANLVPSSVKGNGVKVGVLSDSASAPTVAALIASGDLGPNTTVLPGQGNDGGGEDEGTAMMEIIQDLAPKAQLYFATADISDVQFANNITALGAAGCSIIVDDVTYFDEGVFQDGIIAQAVTSFVNSGGLYFSSAGNSGNKDAGTSGTWEGDFANGGNVGGVIAGAGETGKYHNFAAGQHYDVVTDTGEDIITLEWSDPLGGSNNDYDLFALNSAETTIKAASADLQDGTQDAFEGFQYGATVGDHIVVVKASGAARALHVVNFRGQFSVSTSGATSGHNAGTSTIGCAAAFWGSKKAGTTAFNSADKVELFTSDGPRKLFYLPNGAAISGASNVTFASGGGNTLQQPMLTGTDGVECRTAGFLPFYGTSAGAPHCAAVAALVKSANPSLTNTQIRNILFNSTVDIMGPGNDRDSGFGILLAPPAVNAALGL